MTPRTPYSPQAIVRELVQSRKEGVLLRKLPIVAQQEGASPEEGAEHQENPDIIREVREPMVPLQEIQHRQDVVPVVSICFFSGHAADEHEIQGAGVVDVGGDIHQTLRRPPQGHRGAERIMRLDQECTETNHRHENLAERASQNCHESTERHEDEMAGFVKRQIDQMQERFAGVIRLERRCDKGPPPPHHGHKHNRPAVEGHGFGRRV